MRKRVIAMALALLLTLSIPAFAETRSVRANPVLSFSGTTAFCSVPVRGNGQTYTLTASGTVGGIVINATPVTKTCP